MPIGGAGDVQENVNAGMAAQPLATSADPSVVGAGAVENLVNSFRNGSITMNDILDRVDNVAQAGRKSRMQQLSEFVSPEAIASRKAQVQAAGATANLEAQKAHAQSQLLPAESQFAQAKLTKEQSDLLNKNATDTFLQYNSPIYKTDKEGKPTSEPDYPAMADAGRPYVRAGTAQQVAAQGLTVVGAPEVITDKTGTHTIYRNALREDISPGSDAFEYYHGLRQQAMDIFMKPAKGAKGSSGGGSGLVQPSSAVSDSDYPEVMPTRPAAAGAPAVGGVLTAPPAGTLAPDVYKRLTEDPWRNEWAAKSLAIGALPQIKADYGKLDKNGGPTTNNDNLLMNALMQLRAPGATPGARGGQVSDQVEYIEHGQPVVTTLSRLKETLLRTEKFAPEIRDQLLAQAENLALVREKNAQSAIKSKVKENPDIVGMLSGPEAVLLARDLPATPGESVRAGDIQPAAAPAATGTGYEPGAIQVVSGTRKGQWVVPQGNGFFRPAKPQ
jgi:hypothetical protein